MLTAVHQQAPWLSLPAPLHFSLHDLGWRSLWKPISDDIKPNTPTCKAKLYVPETILYLYLKIITYKHMADIKSYVLYSPFQMYTKTHLRWIVSAYLPYRERQVPRPPGVLWPYLPHWKGFAPRSGGQPIKSIEKVSSIHNDGQ